MRTVANDARQGGAVSAGPVPFTGFRAVGWRGKVYWFQPWERGVIRRLFAAAVGGPPVMLAEATRSLRLGNDAWGELIVEGPGGRLELAERPAYLLSRLG
jgi:hypothetical protein